MSHLRLVPPPIENEVLAPVKQLQFGYYVAASKNLCRVVRMIQMGMTWHYEGALWCPSNQIWLTSAWDLHGNNVCNPEFNLTSRVEFKNE